MTINQLFIIKLQSSDNPLIQELQALRFCDIRINKLDNNFKIFIGNLFLFFFYFGFKTKLKLNIYRLIFKYL